MTVQTGLITSVWAIVDLAVFLAIVSSDVDPFLSATLTHCYSQPACKLFPAPDRERLTNAEPSHLIFNFPLAKLYSNSLLSSLNARASLDGRMTTSESQGAQHKSPHSGRALVLPIITISFFDGLTFVQGPEQIVSFNNTVRPEVYVDVESHELSDRIDSKPGDVYDGSQQSYYSPGAKTNPV